jgi:hypothetical protein
MCPQRLNRLRKNRCMKGRAEANPIYKFSPVGTPAATLDWRPGLLSAKAVQISEKPGLVCR